MKETIEKTAYIVGAGEFTRRDLPEKNGGGAYFLAADGGLRHLEACGLVPDLVIGDFDSLGYVPEHLPEIIPLPVEKDDTDMEAAIRCVWEKGYRDIRLYGAYGDRPDHFLANLQLLAHFSRQGGSMRLVAPAFTVYALTDGRMTLQGEAGTTFSVLASGGGANGVSITGDVKYPAKEIALSDAHTIGVSNLLQGSEAQILVERGTVFVFLYISPAAM